LIRASGPALQAFGVPGTLPDPELQLFETDSRYKGLLRSNSGWGANLYDALQISSSAEAAGAFPWTDTSSHDAAMSEELQNGSYTANVSGSSGDTGVAIAEVYDLTLPDYFGPTCPRLINMSARSYAGSGLDSLIAGFVIGGSSPKTVLIRASGPALIPFGVAGILPDPMLQLFSTGSGSTLLASNTGWGGDPRIVIAAARTGAFSWGSSATADSALLVTLAPGPYTANVTGAGGDTGVVLVEVYEVQ